MTRRRRPHPPERIGLFGLLGSGNLGNDASLEAVLDGLRSRFPDAQLIAMCAGSERISAAHGIPTIPLHVHEYGRSRRLAPLLKIWGKVLDTFRTAAFVRSCDVVVIPGMGVLETTLPMRPWGWPYQLYALSASGRLLGTKVAFVGVGASEIRATLTRWLIVGAARNAAHRSYRDQFSKDALSRMGLDTTHDEVHPDLAFALPEPPCTDLVPRSVAVGVMSFHGGNDDRARAAQIHAAYLNCITAFIDWLLDDGRQVRLLIGDQVDREVVEAVLADVARRRPDLEAERIVADPIDSYAELMRQIGPVDVVVASRYHNVLAALKLGKPTVALGYGTKNDVLMTAMGLGAYTQSMTSLDLARLKTQFADVDSRRDQLIEQMANSNREQRKRLEGMFDGLPTAFASSRRGALPTWAVRRSRTARSVPDRT